MAAIKYKVKLTESERTCLHEVSHRGKPSVRTVKRALALLKADEGLGDREIADVLLISAATVARARKRYVEEGLEAAINDRPWPGRERKLDGKQEAHLIAFACSARCNRYRAAFTPALRRKPTAAAEVRTASGNQLPVRTSPPSPGLRAKTKAQRPCRSSPT